MKTKITTNNDMLLLSYGHNMTQSNPLRALSESMVPDLFPREPLLPTCSKCRGLGLVPVPADLKVTHVDSGSGEKMIASVWGDKCLIPESGYSEALRSRGTVGSLEAPRKAGGGKRGISERICIVRRKGAHLERQEPYLQNLESSYEPGQKGQQR